jgi:hypothetical protein
MWIAPSLRVGIALLATFALWLTPWSGTQAGAGPRGDRPALIRGGGPSTGESLAAVAHTFVFRTPADADLTAWALARFEGAGLELPDLVIAYHDDKEPCTGHPGFYRSGPPARVAICGFNWDRFVVSARKTVLHELAHAWAGSQLSEEDRRRFVEFRGLATWGDDQIPWIQQGSEQAADIIAWAMDPQIGVGAMEDADPASLARAYLHLTGTLPLPRIVELLDGKVMPAWAKG